MSAVLDAITDLAEPAAAAAALARLNDRLLPWPAAAARLRAELLPQADWVLLDGVGHCPQLDVPLETAELITGLTRR